MTNNVNNQTPFVHMISVFEQSASNINRNKREIKQNAMSLHVFQLFPVVLVGDITRQTAIFK